MALAEHISRRLTDVVVDRMAEEPVLALADVTQRSLQVCRRAVERVAAPGGC